MKSKWMLAILLCFIFIFTACNGDCGGTVSDTGAELTALTDEATHEITDQATVETPLPPVSLEGYKVIRSEKASPTLSSVATSLKNALDLTIGTDWAKDEEDIPESALEILVGNTNRPESAELADGLRSGEFAVKYFAESGRIAVCGFDETETLKAVRYFLDHCVSNTAIDAELAYFSAESNEVEECLINGIPIDRYTIVIPTDADSDEKYAAALIAESVLAKTGVKLKTAKSSTDRAIIINKGESEGTYAVGMSGENVLLEGKGGLCVKAAREFLEMLFPKGEKNVSLELEEAKTIPFERIALPELSDFGTKPIALADQKNASIAVYDLASGTAELKYEFKPDKANGFSLKGYENRVDEARLRYSAEWGSYVICFTSSSGYCAVASYPEEKCLWQADLAGTSPHSIEYIPGGFVAVASSGGNDTSKGFVRLYSAKNNAYAEVRLVSAHAVLWDETREILWAMGNTEIVAYELTLDSRIPMLTKIAGYGTAKMQGGHDLSAIPGNDNRVWVGGSIVRIFDKTTGELIDNYAGAMQMNKSNVKCICAFPDGTAALTVATGVYAAHDTDRFNLYTFGLTIATPTEFIFDGRAFYKARAFIASYN